MSKLNEEEIKKYQEMLEKNGHLIEEINQEVLEDNPELYEYAIKGDICFGEMPEEAFERNPKLYEMFVKKGEYYILLKMNKGDITEELLEEAYKDGVEMDVDVAMDFVKDLYNLTPKFFHKRPQLLQEFINCDWSIFEDIPEEYLSQHTELIETAMQNNEYYPFDDDNMFNYIPKNILQNNPNLYRVALEEGVNYSVNVAPIEIIEDMVLNEETRDLVFLRAFEENYDIEAKINELDIVSKHPEIYGYLLEQDSERGEKHTKCSGRWITKEIINKNPEMIGIYARYLDGDFEMLDNDPKLWDKLIKSEEQEKHIDNINIEFFRNAPIEILEKNPSATQHFLELLEMKRKIPKYSLNQKYYQLSERLKEAILASDRKKLIPDDNKELSEEDDISISELNDDDIDEYPIYDEKFLTMKEEKLREEGIIKEEELRARANRFASYAKRSHNSHEQQTVLQKKEEELSALEAEEKKISDLEKMTNELDEKNTETRGE